MTRLILSIKLSLIHDDKSVSSLFVYKCEKIFGISVSNMKRYNFYSLWMDIEWFSAYVKNQANQHKTGNTIILYKTNVRSKQKFPLEKLKFAIVNTKWWYIKIKVY